MHNYFEDIVSVDNLLLAWSEFIKGKRNKPDVLRFSFNLMDNILALHRDLVQKVYRHGAYKKFHICDPKQRTIHKALARDRLLHHAIYRVLYPIYDRTFIADSFSCRNKKGTHKAIVRFKKIYFKISNNNTKTCWVLKCDIKKFFDSVNHIILLNIIKRKVTDKNILWLLSEIICSFNKYPVQQELFERERKRERERVNTLEHGIPIGNLTSQLFANIYLNELDLYLKHKLKVKHYIRYADDFVILSQSKCYLVELVSKIESFLSLSLKLKIHSKKIIIKTVSSGVDFLGWINFPDHRVLRTTTKKRMIRKIKLDPTQETINSYLGLLKHGNTRKIINAHFEKPTKLKS